MFLLVTDENLSIYIAHCCKDIREKEEKSHFGVYPKILSQGWYWWGVWETLWKSSMQTGRFLLVTDTRKRVRRKVFKKSSRPNPKYCFLLPQYGHFCQKCPSLCAQKCHFGYPNKNSFATFISPTSPKNDEIAFGFKRLTLLGWFWASF